MVVTSKGHRFEIVVFDRTEEDEEPKAPFTTVDIREIVRTLGKHNGIITIEPTPGSHLEMLHMECASIAMLAPFKVRCSCHEALGHLSSCDYWHHPSSRSCELLTIWEPPR